MQDAFHCESGEGHLEELRRDGRSVEALLALYAVKPSIELRDGNLRLMPPQFVTDGAQLREDLERLSEVLEALDGLFSDSGDAEDAEF